MFGARTGCDVDRPQRAFHIRRVPDASWIDHRVTRLDVKASFAAVDFLNELGLTFQHDHQLVTFVVTLPGQSPGLVSIMTRRPGASGVQCAAI